MTLALGPGAYRLVPSEKLREWDDRLRDLLSDDGLSKAFGDTAEFHEFTIEDADGRPVLELVRKRVELPADEEGLVDRVFGGEGGPMRSVKDVYLFRPPDGEPVLTLDVPRGLRYVYTLTDAETAEVLATWEKSRWLFGNWNLETPQRGHVATVKWSRWLRELNPLRRQGTYVVYGTDGSELGEFRRVDFEGDGLSDRVFSQLDIQLSHGLSAEVGLAFAFGIFRQARRGRHTHT